MTILLVRIGGSEASSLPTIASEKTTNDKEISNKYIFYLYARRVFMRNYNIGPESRVTLDGHSLCGHGDPKG